MISILQRAFDRLAVFFFAETRLLRVLPVVPDVLHVVVILEHVELYPHVLDTVLANELDASVSLGFIIVQP